MLQINCQIKWHVTAVFVFCVQVLEMKDEVAWGHGNLQSLGKAYSVKMLIYFRKKQYVFCFKADKHPEKEIWGLEFTVFKVCRLWNKSYCKLKNSVILKHCVVCILHPLHSFVSNSLAISIIYSYSKSHIENVISGS